MMRDLVNQATYIIREAVANYDRVACFWSTGKDSTTTVDLLRQAVPREKLTQIPIIHVDTGKKFRQIYEFRERIAAEWRLNLVIANASDYVQPKKFDTEECCFHLKTLPIKEIIEALDVQAIFASIRRDEHGIRAKERHFSPRFKAKEGMTWQYYNQPVEYGNIFQTEFGKNIHHVRVHPILDWTERDVWEYIKRNNLPINPLYFQGYRCFDEKTRLLTKDGLKSLKELKKNDEIATLKDGEYLEYHKPSQIFVYDYDGEMIHFTGRIIDHLVTPNHLMYCRRRYAFINRTHRKLSARTKHLISAYNKVRELRGQGLTYREIATELSLSSHTIPCRWCNGTTNPNRTSRPQNSNFILLEAQAMLKQLRPASLELKRDCEWHGLPIVPEYWQIPDEFLKRGKRHYHYSLTSLRFKLDDYLQLLGWYLSEGYCLPSGFAICQTKSREKKLEIRKLLRRMKIGSKYYEDSFRANSAPLARYFKQFGTSHHKFIPRWIKELPKTKLAILLRTLLLGDGSSKPNGWSKYTTASWRLANDVVEIGLKCGFAISLNKDQVCWNVCLSKIRTTPRLTNTPNKVHYVGKIWCVDVQNHVIMVERNGKFCWTGNSLGCECCTGRIWNPPPKDVDDIIRLVEGDRREGAERAGRIQDKERAYVMQRQRAMGYP